VRDEFLGEKFGELLLKQVLWFAQHNEYDVAYLTVFPKHAFLIDLLVYYGFRQTKTLPNGELMMEKVIAYGTLPAITGSVFEFDRMNYPRFAEGDTRTKVLRSNSARLPSPSLPGDCFWRRTTTFSKGDIRSHA
jgi:hypothetical protein